MLCVCLVVTSRRFLQMLMIVCLCLRGGLRIRMLNVCREWLVVFGFGVRLLFRWVLVCFGCCLEIGGSWVWVFVLCCCLVVRLKERVIVLVICIYVLVFVGFFLMIHCTWF